VTETLLSNRGSSSTFRTCKAKYCDS